MAQIFKVMNEFKLFGGKQIHDIVEYVKDYVANNVVDVYIGTDSRRSKYKVTFATAICFKHNCNGAHVVFKRTIINNKLDLFSRLWHEVELTVEVANLLKDNLNIKPILDIDFNINKSAGSNIVHDAAVGYLVGLGYDVRSKPNAWAASCAADLLCKK